MSEFKFACPVCGQHITTDSSMSGGRLECPTCFRKIVVPQAPTSTDPKFILSAAQADRPRPPQSGFATDEIRRHRPAPSSVGLLIAAFVVLCLAGAAAYAFRDKLLSVLQGQKPPAPKAEEAKIPPPPEYHPIPTNISWTLNLTNVTVPQETAAGSIHSNGFLCDRAILQGGTLTLREGRNGPVDLGIVVRLFAQQGEELSGKAMEVTPDRQPPLPRVTLRWRDEGEPKASQQNITNGYAMRLAFGQAVNGRMAGRIYICLPDEHKSFVAGTFEAELRKASPQKQKKQPPKPGG